MGRMDHRKRSAKADTEFQISSVWKEVYCEKEHDSVPAKKSFGVDREDLVVISVGDGCVGAGRSVWGTGDHHPHLVMLQWAVWKEAARAVHNRVGN
jgi:hypothetical protein